MRVIIVVVVAFVVLVVVIAVAVAGLVGVGRVVIVVVVQVVVVAIFLVVLVIVVIVVIPIYRLELPRTCWVTPPQKFVSSQQVLTVFRAPRASTFSGIWTASSGRHLGVQNWSVPRVLCTFSLPNVLRATTVSSTL